MASTLSEPKTIRIQPLGLRLSSSQQTFLKWLALGLMLLDHANRTLWSFQPWAFALGRIAFPLFAFLIAYNLTVRGVKPGRYILPLLLFGVISQAPAMLALGRDVLPMNIFFTLLLGLSFLPLRSWLGRHLPKGRVWQGLSWLVGLYPMLLLGIGVEYGPLGVLLTPSILLLLKRPTVGTGVLVTLLLATINTPHLTSLASWLVIPLVCAVRTFQLPRLPRLKWFFYSFYPGHLLILWLLKVTI